MITDLGPAFFTLSRLRKRAGVRATAPAPPTRINPFNGGTA
jgi:hypothetical protein